MSNTSGKTLGKEYLKKIQDYLAKTEALPVSRDGTLNITAIADKAGVPKQSIYKNPGIRDAVEKAKTEKGLASWAEVRSEASKPASAATKVPGITPGLPAERKATVDGNKRLQAAERRASTLEQQNAALVAENFEFRRQLKDLRQQMGREDMMIDTGRRIPGAASKANA